MAGINFIRRWVMGQMKKTADDGIMITLPDSNKVDLNVSITMDRLIRNGIDPDQITSTQQVENALNMINSRMANRAIPADSAEGREITEKIFGKQKAPVFDMEGNRIPEGSGIMGGKSLKNLMESGQVTKGARGMDKSKKVQDREMFQAANERLTSDVDSIIKNIKSMEPITAMKEANSVIGRKGKYKNLTPEESKKILQDTEDHIFERDIPEEDFASGGIAGMLGERPRYQTGGDVAFDASDASIFGSNAITVTPETVADAFGNQVQQEMGNTYNPPLIEDVIEEKAAVEDTKKEEVMQRPSDPDTSDLPIMAKIPDFLKQPKESNLGTAEEEYAKIQEGKNRPSKDLRYGENMSFEEFKADYDAGKTPMQSGPYKGPPLLSAGGGGLGLFGKLPGLGIENNNSMGNESDPIMKGFQESEFRKNANMMQQDAVNFKYNGKDMMMNGSMAGAFQQYLDSIGKGDLMQRNNSLGGGLGQLKQFDFEEGRPILDVPFARKMPATPIATPGPSLTQEAIAMPFAMPTPNTSPIGQAAAMANGGRAGFAGGGMGRRGFLKLLAGAGAGIAGLKSGLVNIMGKGAGKEVAKEVVKQSTSTPPPYFFKLAEKIKNLGADATATTERVIAKSLKSKDGKSDYLLEEDMVTGDTIIKKINKEGDEMITDVQIMELRKGEVVKGKDGRPVRTPDQYEEVTEANARIEGDVFNDPYYTDGIEIDDIMREVGEQAPSIKKASGGIARMLGE